MKKIIYSRESLIKIKEIEAYLRETFGYQTALNASRNLKLRIKSLKNFPYQGSSFRDLYGIDTDYRQLYVPPNHVIYYIEEDSIEIINIYNDKEDYFSKLF